MPDYGEYDKSRVIERMSSKDVLEADQLLVGRNSTRYDMNRKIRKLKNLDPDNPVVGDRITCLQNDKDLGIFNGGIFNIQQILDTKYKTNFLRMRLESQDEDRPPIMVKVHKSFFLDEVDKPDWKVLKGSQQFDYSYAITVHRAQGSQWPNVTIMDESWCFRDDRWKWLYTALTRASERITLVRN
jgi:exodeoxyribonuclease-5